MLYVGHDADVAAMADDQIPGGSISASGMDFRSLTVDFPALVGPTLEASEAETSTVLQRGLPEVGRG